MLKGESKMKALYELKEKFEMELEELARKGELGAGDLELAHKLTDTIKNIDKICALEEFSVNLHVTILPLSFP